MLILYSLRLICLKRPRVLQVEAFDSSYLERIFPIHSRIRHQRSVAHQMVTSILVQAHHHRRSNRRHDVPRQLVSQVGYEGEKVSARLSIVQILVDLSRSTVALN